MNSAAFQWRQRHSGKSCSLPQVTRLTGSKAEPEGRFFCSPEGSVEQASRWVQCSPASHARTSCSGGAVSWQLLKGEGRVFGIWPSPLLWVRSWSRLAILDDLQLSSRQPRLADADLRWVSGPQLGEEVVCLQPLSTGPGPWGAGGSAPFSLGRAAPSCVPPAAGVSLGGRGTSSYKRPLPGFCLSSRASVSVLRFCVLCQRFLADRWDFSVPQEGREGGGTPRDQLTILGAP